MLNYLGRQVIYSDEEVITRDNLVSVLTNAMNLHAQNSADISYLYNYYKGYQPILDRVKEHSTICNHIVENRAYEIVSFKTGYLLGEPIQYVNRSGDESMNDPIERFNRFMVAENKDAKDKELVDWFTICGTAYRLILPAKKGDLSPVRLYTLDPRNSFVIYWSGLGNKPLAGVRYVKTQTGEVIYSVWTENRYYEITDGSMAASQNGKAITKEEPVAYGRVPLIEYPANSARLGAFEIVLPLLDAINACESDRLDAIDAFVDALMVFKNVDIKAPEFLQLKEMGAIKIPADGDVSYLVEEMNQNGSQTVVNDLYQSVLTICGMPNRNGGLSTSDTGTAVKYRDGFVAAEQYAKNSESVFRKSEYDSLALMIKIANAIDPSLMLNVETPDVEIRFTRRNYENISEKSTVLTTMLANPHIAPQLAFQHCGMFADPDLAARISEEYYEQYEKKQLDILNSTAGIHEDEGGEEEDVSET